MELRVEGSGTVIPVVACVLQQKYKAMGATNSMSCRTELSALHKLTETQWNALCREDVFLSPEICTCRFSLDN